MSFALIAKDAFEFLKDGLKGLKAEDLIKALGTISEYTDKLFRANSEKEVTIKELEDKILKYQKQDSDHDLQLEKKLEGVDEKLKGIVASLKALDTQLGVISAYLADLNDGSDDRDSRDDD